MSFPYYANSPYGTFTPVASSVQTEAYDEPVTMAEAQDFLANWQPADTSLISGMISAAREEAECAQWRELCIKQYEYVLDQFPYGPIELLDPLLSVQSVSYKDSTGLVTTLTENVDYVVDLKKHPGLIVPPFGHIWPYSTPWPSSAVVVRFTCGMTPAQVPWVIKQGIKMLVTAWYEKRLPWDDFRGQVAELPFAVSSAFAHGSIKRFA